MYNSICFYHVSVPTLIPCYSLVIACSLPYIAQITVTCTFSVLSESVTETF